METATRYLSTIESLMTDNSRLTKELNNAVKGILPSRIISQEIADQCFSKIADIMGPVANGSLLDEVNIICSEFIRIGQEYGAAVDSIKAYKKQHAAIEKIINGDDIDGNYITPLIRNVSRLRAVLEVTCARLSRLVASGNNELLDLHKEVSTFLSSGNKNE